MKVSRAPSNSSSSSIVPMLACVVLGAALHHAFLLTKSSESKPAARTPGTAWTLTVSLTFSNEEDQQQILEDWKPVTKYCAEKEPFLFQYEVGRSDSDPLKLYMVERYKSKDDYLKKHKNGEEFLKFRPKLKALQDAGKVKIEGFSYQELGYGFA